MVVMVRSLRSDRRRHFLAGSGLLLAAVAGCSAADRAAADRVAIEHVLAVQADAWNRGDVEAFMDHYLKSDDLTFSAGGRTTRGWRNTLDRYRKRYPDRAAMGRLRFGDLETTLLGPRAALVLGNWHLTRSGGDIGGNFSLVFQKVGGRWVIRHDHTSQAGAAD